MSDRATATRRPAASRPLRSAGCTGRPAPSARSTAIAPYRQSDAETEPDGSGEDRDQDRARAARELGDALRELTAAATSTEVDAATLRKVADEARDLAGPLRAATRDRHTPPSVDEARPGRRMYNPAVGPGNPIAPPMRVEVGDGVVVGTCTLGLAYEGPHSYTHGGVSAMLIDQILGHAHAVLGKPGMTVALSLRYRKPVPLETPLRLTGWVPEDSVTGRRTGPKATITTADEPDKVLVEASGVFVVPSAEQASRIFGDSRPPHWSNDRR